MKNWIIVLTAVLSSKAAAQMESSTGFDQNRAIVSAGLGTGNFLNLLIKEGTSYVRLNHDIKTIYFIKGEYAVHKNISVGLNYAHNGFDVSYRLPDTIKAFTNKVPVEVAVKYRSWSIMPRVNFHITPGKTVDVYTGFGIGYRHNDFEFSDNDPNINWDLPLGIVPSLGMDFTLGARAYVTPNIAVYTEVGMAKAILQGGLSFQF